MRSILTVTTPATEPGLLTLAEIRAATGVSDVTQDAALQALGLRVSSAIATACNVARAGVAVPTLRQEVLSETFRLECGAPTLIVGRRPVVSVTSIVEAGTTLDAEDYEIDAGPGLVARLCDDEPSWWSSGKIVVAYTAGWATVPDDLKLAAEKLAALFWADSRRGDPNLRSIKVDGVSEKTFWVGPADDPLIPAEIMEALGPYMNISV